MAASVLAASDPVIIQHVQEERHTDENEFIEFDVPNQVDCRRPGCVRACDLDPVVIRRSCISEVSSGASLLHRRCCNRHDLQRAGGGPR